MPGQSATLYPVSTVFCFINTLLLNYGSTSASFWLIMAAFVCFLASFVTVQSKARLLELHEHDDVSHDDGAEAQKLPSLQVNVAQEIEWRWVGHSPGEHLQFSERLRR